jgi:hypothetical protein
MTHLCHILEKVSPWFVGPIFILRLLPVTNKRYDHTDSVVLKIRDILVGTHPDPLICTSD